MLHKIYVRTLESYPERTEWAKKELARVGIVDYEFYQNLDRSSKILDKWKDEGKIKLGPECFQCQKLDCSCRAKILTRGMVANFISTLMLFEKIIQDEMPDDTMYMIMEDDIYFQDNAKDVIEHTFGEDFRKTFNTKKPLLLKLGWGDMMEYRQTHYEVSAGMHVFKKESNKFSNPCYAGNKHLFKFLLKEFKRIETACDMWIHRYMSPKVENYEIIPALCKELSHVGSIPSAMHIKYSTATKFLDLFSRTQDQRYIDKFIEAEKEYFNYWFKYGKNEWGIDL